MKRTTRTEHDHYEYEDRTCAPCPGTSCPACGGAGVFRVSALKGRTITTVTETVEPDAPAPKPVAPAPKPPVPTIEGARKLLEEAARQRHARVNDGTAPVPAVSPLGPNHPWSHFDATPRITWTADGSAAEAVYRTFANAPDLSKVRAR